MNEDFMTTEQAAEHLNRTTSLICKLCKRGKLLGARRIGKKMWIIPKQSVYDYKPGLRGFALIKARKQAEMDTWLAVAKTTAAQKKEAERA